jgi:hypothetical protein
MDEFQKHIENPAMKRGKACEQMVMDLFLQERPDYTIVDSQVRVEKKLKGVDIPLITTIDYILDYSEGGRFIHECKTTDISIFYKLQGKIPFHYQLQTQMQMSWNNIPQLYITIAGVQTISGGRGKEKTYQILESLTEFFRLDEKLINAITQSVLWFDYELKNNRDEIFNKPDELKTKADLEMDAFLEDFTATKEEKLSNELSTKIERLEELKPLLIEAKKLDEEIKAQIKEVMGVSRKLKLTSPQFDIVANFTKPAFLDEAGILEEIEKAKVNLQKTTELEIGAAKSRPSLRWKLEKRSN